jgi:hypothetical protein
MPAGSGRSRPFQHRDRKAGQIRRGLRIVLQLFGARSRLRAVARSGSRRFLPRRTRLVLSRSLLKQLMLYVSRD